MQIYKRTVSLSLDYDLYRAQFNLSFLTKSQNKTWDTFSGEAKIAIPSSGLDLREASVSEEGQLAAARCWLD